jgi:hypothetical protein
LCDARCDDDDGREIDGLWFCEECAPEAEILSRRQVTCVLCRGKCLDWFPEKQGDRPRWLPCVACQGKGWTTGIVARWNGIL